MARRDHLSVVIAYVTPKGLGGTYCACPRDCP
ncbi:MAG: hypothetical protein JWP02_3220 [Acidimicrobiales bacterium]|nr:hypothetical protein [Acidimicrobiales bacterium]